MLSLDRTAVCRLGSPTLGVPILELGFRGADPLLLPDAPAAVGVGSLADAVITALWAEIARLDQQIVAQAARIARLETPWWRRTWARLQAWWMRIDG